MVEHMQITQPPLTWHQELLHLGFRTQVSLCSTFNNTLQDVEMGPPLFLPSLLHCRVSRTKLWDHRVDRLQLIGGWQCIVVTNVPSEMETRVYKYIHYSDYVGMSNGAKHCAVCLARLISNLQTSIEKLKMALTYLVVDAHSRWHLAWPGRTGQLVYSSEEDDNHTCAKGMSAWNKVRIAGDIILVCPCQHL